MRKLIAQILTALLFLIAVSASALTNAEKTYQIEVIVFSHITAKGVDSEKWPWTPTDYKPNGNAASIFPVARNSLILSSEQRQLAKQPGYQILLHMAWRQKIANPRNAQPIHIFGGNIYNNSGRLIGQATYGGQPYSASKTWQVNGTITPSLIRYIDLKFNLLFAQPLASLPTADKSNNVEGNFAYFRLNQSRRMRSRELNYLGHPLYGVLVKVVPVA
ncbi:MAG: hypothetical protein KDH94_01305 [Coxiellaceae bacterium]|nr:hypothetical protein [Coxiellaceae bacterium]